jgi:hypothetical protein
VLLHVHSVIMSFWCLLFFVQAYPVATHRIRVHRRLGILGPVLAFLLVAIGTVEATAREVQSHIVGRFHYLFESPGAKRGLLRQ